MHARLTDVAQAYSKFGNLAIMTQSLVRFSRGFLCGILVGAAVLTFGLASWGIALVVGVEKDASTEGMSLLPIYVLSFGLGGGVVGMFEAGDKVKSIKSVCAWAFAVIIVLSGCFFMASSVVSRETVDPAWGVISGAALFVLVTLALAIATSNKTISTGSANHSKEPT